MGATRTPERRCPTGTEERRRACLVSPGRGAPLCGRAASVSRSSTSPTRVLSRAVMHRHSVVSRSRCGGPSVAPCGANRPSTLLNPYIGSSMSEVRGRSKRIDAKGAAWLSSRLIVGHIASSQKSETGRPGRERRTSTADTDGPIANCATCQQISPLRCFGQTDHVGAFHP
jgi:hypothetical protein